MRELYQYGSRCDLTCVYKGLPRMIRGVTLLYKKESHSSDHPGEAHFRFRNRIFHVVGGVYVFL